MQNFESLGLSEPIVKALTDLSITTPTPIQAQTIPLLLERSIDMLGLAQTGTGKTAAFGLPLLETVNTDLKSIQAIVLAPTRELAQQIAEQLKLFSKYMKGLSVSTVYGGAPISSQINDLKKNKPQIVVATPGRMIDFIDRKVLNLSNVCIVVLDEADEMLNMGFKEDIDTILSFTQHDKNTWLFSATMPREIRDLSAKYMKDPVEVSVRDEQKVNVDIEHLYAIVKRHDKQEALRRLLDSEGEFYGLIFCRTKAETQRLATSLSEAGYPIDGLHGDMSQGQRDNVMRKFKAKRVKMLVATDVAARGIDVDNLTHVIHYDMPDDLAFYTHRSGRTGRAGRKGIAIALMSPNDVRKVKQLEKQLGIGFKKYVVPSADEVKAAAIEAKMEEILAVEATDDSREWAHAIADKLEFLSKEELLAKVITQSMKVIGKSTSGDLNATAGSDRSSGDRGRRADKGRKPDRSKRGDRKSEGKEEGMTSFKINLGKSDELRTGDMLKIICDTSGVRSKHIGRINMNSGESYFDVESDKAKGLAEAFKGLRFKGRPLKVEQK
ncbi:MAG: DEAD/DEAH box helicase [Salibacteraceae bacterium]